MGTFIFYSALATGSRNIMTTNTVSKGHLRVETIKRLCSENFQHGTKMEICHAVLMKYVLINSQVHFEMTIWYNVCLLNKIFINSGDRGGTVVKVLCYKSEGRWSDPSWCRWIFH